VTELELKLQPATQNLMLLPFRYLTTLEAKPVKVQQKSQSSRQVHGGITAIIVINSHHETWNLTPRGDVALSLNGSYTLPLDR
jgi:hypothetical protein